MSAEIIVAILSLVGTLTGSYFANRKKYSNDCLSIREIGEKVQSHNNLDKRMYRVEERTELQEEKIRVVNHPNCRSGKEKCMKNKEYWQTWWWAAGVRAIKTVAQTAVATIGTTAVVGGSGLATGSISIGVGQHPVPVDQHGGITGGIRREEGGGVRL